MTGSVGIIISALAFSIGLFIGTESIYGKDITHAKHPLNIGKKDLNFSAQWGYLPSLLRVLKIEESSQVLVFSKTSSQFRLISPRIPRAIYFNDSIYVGWVPGGHVIEISSTDPRKGGVFYTLEQKWVENPRIIEDQGQCLQCHESGRTLHIPGHLTRSVYPSSDGTPFFELGTVDVDHTTDIRSRFGGWYVTGTLGGLTHRGNYTMNTPKDHLYFESGPSSEVIDLRSVFDVRRYLTPHSDIVAHLVLAHQTQMHNYISLANIEARRALEYRKEMIRLFGESFKDIEDSVQRRIKNVSEKLLRYLLFVDEAPLKGSVRGTTLFAKKFEKMGLKDHQGRSFRKFDLNRRLFRYPCSFLIYSPNFAELPTEVLSHIFTRLDEILTGRDTSKDFRSLSDQDRNAIREILIETSPHAKKFWPTERF